MIKDAALDHPIHDLIARRWSPYAFADRSVPVEDLWSLFEAARWAPSSFSEQPWAYFVARREEADAFRRMLSCLTEGNQRWAKDAPVLALGTIRTTFASVAAPNPIALHDLGLASAMLVIEAMSRGVAVHQMAGILPERIADVYRLPTDVEAKTALAIGYPGDPDRVAEKHRRRDLTPRTRRPLPAFVFGEAWGRPSPILPPDERSDGSPELSGGVRHRRDPCPRWEEE
jgi:nitroreductase